MRRVSWGARAHRTYFARGILEARSTLHLTYRLSVRTAQFVSVSGAASPGSGLWRLVLPIFALADVVTWLVLRQNDAFLLPWRVAVDSLDISFWSLSPHPPRLFYDASVLVGMPLAIEAGFRIGVLALGIPAVELAITGTVRAAAGRPVHPFTFTWLLVGIGLGMALFTYCRSLHDQAVAERARQRAADTRRAFLAGQNAVAMGASSVVDSIEGLVPILGRPEPGSALWQLADGWKARLGQSTAEAATYLQVSLLEWERRHNRHPDLSGDVELHIDEGTGTTLLTPWQSRSLNQSLDQLGLRGRVIVSVSNADARARPIGAPLVLHAGPNRVLVPADTTAIHRPVDPAPVTYALMAEIVLSLNSPNNADVPWPSVLVGIAVCVAAGWWSHRRLRQRGRSGQAEIVWCAIAVGLGLTVLLALTGRHDMTVDGDPTYTFTGIMLFAVLVGMYSHDLEGKLAAAVLLAAAGVVAIAVAVVPVPFSLPAMVGALIWNIAPYPTCRRISITLAKASELYVEATRAEEQKAVQAAFRRGQDDVVTLVREARDDAYRQLAELAPTIPAKLATVATKRLEEVDRRLIAINRSAASSSSTTTS